jgi:para-nitrobenzyl esterase
VFTPAMPTATVAGGVVRGALSDRGAVFKGIPFAAPPVGDLRWRPPQPVKPWRSERDATRYSAACMQNPIGTGTFLAPLARRYSVEYKTANWEISEDCLYLNIWTPAWPPKQPAAVMVWLHGGSNRIGTGNETAYDGAELVRRDVVLVTVNYRLGALGFFAHPELSAESPRHASGNYGLLDQVAALRWVHDHIAAFGGDPARVTVFGESAGAIDAGMLLCSPLAAGLFQRVILESGPVVGIAYTHTLEQAERFGQSVAQIALPGRQAPAIKQLRQVPAAELLAAAAQAGRLEPNPEFVLDGWVLPRSPQAVFAAGTQQPAGMMIGNNGREASAFRGAAAVPLSAGQGPMKTLRACYGNMAPVALALYGIDAKLGRIAAADQWLSEALVVCPSAAMAALNTAARRPAYVYQFRRSIPGKGQDDLGSFHGLEIPFVFGTFHSTAWNWLTFGERDKALGDTMRLYWTNFAKTGDPNGGGLPRWQVFNSKTEDYMEFSVDGHAVPGRHVRPALCDLDVAGLKRRLIANQ